MKKLLGIVVLGLLWCNVVIAESVKLSCSPKAYGEADPNWVYEYFEVIIDKGSKNFNYKSKGYYKKKGNQDFEEDENFAIIKIDEKSLTYAGSIERGTLFRFNYGSDYKWTQIKPDVSSKAGFYLNCNKNSDIAKSSGISFTIKDKKEDCAAIGFIPNTEKFADCVLRLVELDVKRKVNDPSMASQSQANQEIANELKRQNNLRQSQFLMNLSQQLLTPSSPASTMTTCRWSGQFLNCW